MSEAVHIDPAILSGTPCISRVPVYMIVEMVWHHGVDEAMWTWDLSRGQILNACWYAAVTNVLHVWTGPTVSDMNVSGRGRRLGVRTRRAPWQKRWGGWAEEVHGALWLQDYDAVPDPPGKDAEAVGSEEGTREQG